MKIQRLLLLFIFVIISVALVSVFGGCTKKNNTPTTTQSVSLEQAKNTLNTIVEYASSQDVEKLCSLGASLIMTKRQLEDAGGWESLPSQFPKIAETYIIDPQVLSGSTVLGGRVLVLEGTTGVGKSYRTEFFVALDPASNKIIVQYPIYWSGIGIGQIDDKGIGTTKQQ